MEDCATANSLKSGLSRFSRCPGEHAQAVTTSKPLNMPAATFSPRNPSL